MYFFSCLKPHRNVKEVQLEKKKNSLYRSKSEMTVGCYSEDRKRLSDTQCNTNPLWRSRIKGSRHGSGKPICIISWIIIDEYWVS